MTRVHSSFPLLVLACLALLAVLVSAAPCTSDDPLQCYINNIVIDVPPACFQVSGTELCLSELKIFSITLTEITSAYIPVTTLLVGLKNAGGQISGTYTYGKYVKGSVVGSIITTAQLGVFVGTDGSPYPLPTLIEFISCSLEPLSVTLSFGNAVLDELAKLMESSIETALITEVCTTFNAELASKTAEVFATKLDPALLALIANGPSIPPIYPSQSYVNWNNSIIGEVHRLLARISKSKAAQCVAQHLPSPLVWPILPAVIDRVVDAATNGTGSITVPLQNNIIMPIGANSTLTIFSVRVDGLDEFTAFNLLEVVPASNVSLSSSLQLASVRLTVDMILQTKTNGGGGGGSYNETLSATLSAKDVLMATETVVLAKATEINALYLDQLSAACLFDSLEAVSFSSLVLKLNLTSVNAFEVKGSAGELESDIVQLIDNAFELMLGGFSNLTESVLAGFVQGPMRAALNEAISLRMKSEAKSCAPHTDRSDEKLLVWPESNTLARIDQIVNERVGVDNLNKIVHCVTDGGTLHFDMKDKVEVAVANLDSFYDLQILTPVDLSSPYTLKNKIGIASVGKPITITVSTPTKMGSLTLQNFHLSLDLLLQLDVNALLNLKLSQLATKGCLGTSIKTLHLDDMNSTVANASVTTATTVRDVQHSIQEFFDLLASPKMLDAMNSHLDVQVSSSEAVCANGGVAPDGSGTAGSGSGSSTGSVKWQVALMVGLGSALCLAVGGVYWMQQRRRKRYQEYPLLSQQVAKEEESISRVEDGPDGQALMLHPLLPLPLRILVPVLICANVALFVTSNSLPDAVTVEATVRYANYSSDAINVFGFSFAGTVRDMWHAKTYFLAILIALFTGVWPYVKLLYLLVAWVAPVRMLSTGRRYQYLKFVDSYGKYSLLDFFVMVLFITAFYFNMALGKELLVTVNVVPHFGFYSFLIATIMSLVLGHMVLWSHRHVEQVRRKTATTLPSEADTTRESLSSHSFQLSSSSLHAFCTGQVESQSPSHTKRVIATRAGKAAVATALIISTVCFLFGVLEETFKFEMLGLTGLLLGSKASTSYSFYSVGEVMPIASGKPHSWAIIVMQVFYFVFGFAMPLTLLASLSIAWFQPLTLNMQRRVFHFAEVAYAWSAFDVFVFAIIAAIFQIQQFAQFIVGDSCDSINLILAKYLDGVLDGEDICFDLIATLVPQTSWLLLVSVALLFFVTLPTMGLLETSITERETSITSVGCEQRRTASATSLNSGSLSRPLLSGEEETEQPIVRTPLAKVFDFSLHSLRLLRVLGLVEAV